MLFQLLEKGCRSSGQMLTLTKPGEKITTDINLNKLPLEWVQHPAHLMPPQHVQISSQKGTWEVRQAYHFWDNTAICTPSGVIHNREIL